MTDKIISPSLLKTFLSCIASKFAKKSELPTKVSQLSNDSGYLTGSSTIYESKLSYNPSTIGNGVLNRSLDNNSLANKLAFLPPSQIIIEKTIDGGKTWQDAGVSDTTKAETFSGVTSRGIAIPGIDGKKNTLCGLRFTFTAQKYNVPVPSK